MLKKYTILAFTLLSGLLAHADCDKPIIFFDLGQTIVDTDTYDFKKVFYMPKGFEYIRELKRRGYHLGLIVNIPEQWGSTRPEKIATLRKFVDDLWTDPNPMAWGAFDLGILVPMNDGERKPAPVLFEQAAAIARSAGCPAIYECENRDELAAARRAGLKPYQVGSLPSFYLPIEKIEDWARHIKSSGIGHKIR